MFLALLGFALALFATPADAQWKWKDKTGRVQYSDLPPPQGTPDADILSRPTSRLSNAPRTTTAPLSAPSVAAVSAAASAGLAPQTSDPELEAKRKKAEADQAAKVKAENERVLAAKAENCKRAQVGLRTLDSGIRVARANDKGEREYFDDKQRADETKRMKDTIAADCR